MFVLVSPTRTLTFPPVPSQSLLGFVPMVIKSLPKWDMELRVSHDRGGYVREICGERTDHYYGHADAVFVRHPVVYLLNSASGDDGHELLGGLPPPSGRLVSLARDLDNHDDAKK